MINSRRISFQLTPLLDLLLIVIFAQYMEMQQVSARTQVRLDNEALQTRQKLEAETEQLRARLTRDHDQRLAQLESRRSDYDRIFQDIVTQQESAGNVLAELFHVPTELLESALRPRNPAQPRTAEDTEQLRQAFRELGERRGRDVIRHVLTYGELRKYCDVWEVYIDDSDNIQFSSGETKRRFRCESQDEFEQKLFDHYKAFDEPKRLVLILLSYGDAVFSVRRMAIEGMPGAIARMRRDRADQNWFEFAVMGFSPEGPALRER